MSGFLFFFGKAIGYEFFRFHFYEIDLFSFGEQLLAGWFERVKLWVEFVFDEVGLLELFWLDGFPGGVDFDDVA